MLILKEVVKEYTIKDNAPVKALKGISLEFPETGFIAILGQSGCGKTTLLNIIGGLDKYTSGDVIINGQSTKDYNDQDWDAYRNREIGIVFQSYNLIPHLSVLGNVELAMTLNGVSSKEREDRAREALTQVGLADQVDKKPNQMSGGQMQRVAIARALVNRPNIILADEPTGALDSKTSVQVMEILKETATKKLVIMVTHNEELAKQYATRIITLSDGNVISDTEKDVVEEQKEVEAVLPEVKTQEKSKKKHTSMSYKTAVGISGRNLLTKKAKTIITAVAASFGIIGVGLVLALTNGFSDYVSRMEAETLSKFPITIEKYGYNYVESETEELERYPDGDEIHIQEPATSQLHVNNITTDYLDYLDSINTEKKTYAKYRYNYSIGMHVIAKYEESGTTTYSDINTSQSSYLQSMASSLLGSSSTAWQELPADSETILENYDVLAGEYPDETFADTDQKEYGLVLVVSSRNALSTTTMTQLGLNPKGNTTYNFDYFMDEDNVSFQYIQADDYYGEAVYNQDSEGNPIYNTGIFFKDEVTFNDISSLLSSILSDGDETETSIWESLFSYMDLPSESESGQIALELMASEDVQAAFTTLQPYLNETAYNDFMNGNISLSDLTAEKIRSYLNEDLIGENATNKEENREIVAQGLYDLITAALETSTLKSHFKRNLTYYETPSSQSELQALYNNESGNNRTLKIGCILRPKSTSSLSLLSSGIYYPKSLTYQSFVDNADSNIANEFKDHIFISPNTSESFSYVNAFKEMIDNLYDENLTNTEILSPITSSISVSMLNIVDSLTPISSISNYMNARLELGTDVVFKEGESVLDERTYASFVTTITIYPSDYECKQYIVQKLTEYNTGKSDSEQIVYTDVGQIATDTVGEIVQVISSVLIAFASISLVVSSVMIAILIYSSVVERTKEIGILRSIGARKKDIGRLFKSEAMIIGFLAGSIGVILTYLISLPINAVMNAIYPNVALGSIAFLNPLHALMLIAISVLLTYIASLIPSRFASNKDPVTCLRSE